jgi:peptidyl-prolyl cis-trans isomerase SurA
MLRISTRLQIDQAKRGSFRCQSLRTLVLLLALLTLCDKGNVYAEGIIIDAVVATVDEEPITLQDVEERLSSRKKLSPDDLHSDLDAQQTLDNIIAERILAAEAKEKRVGVSDAEVSEYIEEVARRNQLSRIEFETVLAKEGKTIEWYKRQVHNDILKTKIVSSMAQGGVSVSDHEIDQYLEGRGSAETQSPTLQLRVIGIDHTGREPEEIAKRLEEIKNRLSSGSKFADVAAAYSEGPNKEEGGLLGLIAEKDLHSEVFDVVFALDEGSVSEPVITDTSTQIFYVEKRFGTEKKDDNTTADQALREEARKAIQQRKTEEKLSSYFAIDIYKNHIVDRKF